MKYPEEIQKELERAVKALEENNDGMARVCARRAVGAAIRQWGARQPRPPVWSGKSQSAVIQLRALAVDEAIPSKIREAAVRLSTTVDRDHKLPFDESPIDDALIIIRHFVG
ncbi:MAG TPA: hypothetical protein VJL59_19165 [Anaerolineales bacterium]|nr:hypothetical protein [Anaerolineales bacterium]